MRYNIIKSSSTKPERIFYEILKRNRIPFKHRVLIEKREIDFIVGYLAIEIDGHSQSAGRNDWLMSLGYLPVHYSNFALLKNALAVEDDIKTKYHGLQSKDS